MSSDTPFDCVIVVGSGHAGSCAALSAIEHGCTRVLIIDKCPEAWHGGNGYFTAGAHRTVHAGLADLLPLVHNVPPALVPTIDVAPYTAEDFTADIQRLAGGRSDRALVQAVVDGSRAAVAWLAEQVCVPFTLAFNRQAYAVRGRQVFWGGMALSTQDGGVGLMRAHREALTRAGVEVRFGTRAVGLVREAGGARAVTGVVVETADGRETLAGRAVVLAAGGYEASAELRERHLGAGWSEARVRGTPYNTGDGIAIATAIGAARAGDWAGCHSTCWDAHAPRDAGDRTLGNQYTKSGYPLGLMLNARGARFVDEGADFRNFTYAAYGRALLAQPGGVAFQVYDARVARWLREEEYGDAVVRTVRADSLEGLARALAADGLEDSDAFVQTVHAYNAASATPEAHGRWDPAVKDGLATRGIAPPKSNWALPLDTPPFAAVKVACGITFTFGGLAVDARTAGVRDDAGACIPGLFCAGEMVGGLWYGNYPGGSGLTAGAVLGRIAGKQAAERAACQRCGDEY